ncbi:hypothetical protein BZM26_33935, partial [Paraburkholderia strydomiana]
MTQRSECHGWIDFLCHQLRLPVTGVFLSNRPACRQARVQLFYATTSAWHKNGSVESSHRHLKKAIDQALILRGHRDFADRAAYENFLCDVVMRRNRRWAATPISGPMSNKHAVTLPLFDESHNRGRYAAAPCWAASQ